MRAFSSSNRRKTADIAFLRIKRRTDGTQQDRILLAEADATAGTSVAVIGYPARAGEDVIPDQAWMERVFAGRYDVKRAAPGVMTHDSHGWATHDCTTLGGNSGSAVIDLATGKAVALHFAGAYVLENYAVPASVVRRYLDRQPWLESAANVDTDSGSADTGGGGGGVSVGALQTAAAGAVGRIGVCHRSPHHHRIDSAHRPTGAVAAGAGASVEDRAHRGSGAPIPGDVSR